MGTDVVILNGAKRKIYIGYGFLALLGMTVQ